MLKSGPATQGCRALCAPMRPELLHSGQRLTGSIIVAVLGNRITGVAVHGEDRLAFLCVDDIDQSGLKRVDELGIVDFRLGGCDSHGIVVDSGSHDPADQWAGSRAFHSHGVHRHSSR